jgi:hypothetical protein
MEYSLQANRKTMEGTSHPDRDAQFEYINAEVRRRMAAGSPVISVDTKKKELVGNFKNGGQQWRPKGRPERVNVHDFLDPKKGKAIPYGVEWHLLKLSLGRFSLPRFAAHPSAVLSHRALRPAVPLGSLGVAG